MEFEEKNKLEHISWVEIEEHRIKDMKVDKTVRIRVGIEEHRTMDIKADELVRIEEHKKVDTEVHIVMGKAWEDK